MTDSPPECTHPELATYPHQRAASRAAAIGGNRAAIMCVGHYHLVPVTVGELEPEAPAIAPTEPPTAPTQPGNVQRRGAPGQRRR